MKKLALVIALASTFPLVGCQAMATKVFKTANSVSPDSITQYPTLDDAYKAYNMFKGFDKDGNRYYADTFQYRGYSRDVQLFTNYDSYRVPVKIAYTFCKFREKGTLERFGLPSIKTYRNVTPYTEQGLYVCRVNNKSKWGVKVEIDRQKGGGSQFAYMRQTLLSNQALQYVISRDIAVSNQANQRSYNDPTLERLDYEYYGK